jgi:hypothetical protein
LGRSAKVLVAIFIPDTVIQSNIKPVKRLCPVKAGFRQRPYIAGDIAGRNRAITAVLYIIVIRTGRQIDGGNT